MDFRSLRFENFPVILFYRMLRAGDAAAERFCRWKGIPLPQWNRTKSQYEKEMMDPAGDPNFERRRELVLAHARLNKTAVLLRWMVLTRKEDLKPIFEAIRIPWIEDPDKRFEFLKREIRKAEKKGRTIAKALDLDDDEDDAEVPNDLSDVYQAIASLELAGFSIPDHDALTLPKYVAMSKIALKRINKDG